MANQFSNVLRRAPFTLYTLVFKDTRRYVCAVDGESDVGMYFKSRDEALREAKRQDELYDLGGVEVLALCVEWTKRIATKTEIGEAESCK